MRKVCNSASEAKLTNRREKNFKKFLKYSLENRKCLEMPRAYIRPTTLMRMNNSYKMRVDGRRCPVRNVCSLHCKSSKSLEGDRGKDRVRRCRLSTSFLQEGQYVNVCRLRSLLTTHIVVSLL